MSSLTRAPLTMTRAHYRRRKIVNALMLALCGLATFLAIIPLFWILFYVTQEGGRFLAIDFFTQLPTPVGVPGGGIANALIGSFLVVSIASLIAIPIAIIAAIYAAEHPNTPLGVAVRFGTDVLSGIPSIVMGIFAYTVVVVPMGQFSASAHPIGKQHSRFCCPHRSMAWSRELCWASRASLAKPRR
jgi:phosphate transport system permease protein